MEPEKSSENELEKGSENESEEPSERNLSSQASSDSEITTCHAWLPIGKGSETDSKKQYRENFLSQASYYLRFAKLISV